MHEFLCRLDLLVELFDLLVMAVALLVIGIELQALAYLTADQTGGGKSEHADFPDYMMYKNDKTTLN